MKMLRLRSSLTEKNKLRLKTWLKIIKRNKQLEKIMEEEMEETVAQVEVATEAQETVAPAEVATEGQEAVETEEVEAPEAVEMEEVEAPEAVETGEVEAPEAVEMEEMGAPAEVAMEVKIGDNWSRKPQEDHSKVLLSLLMEKSPQLILKKMK
jgi:hypothetical protein